MVLKRRTWEPMSKVAWNMEEEIRKAMKMQTKLDQNISQARFRVVVNSKYRKLNWQVKVRVGIKTSSHINQLRSSTISSR